MSKKEIKPTPIGSFISRIINEKGASSSSLYEIEFVTGSTGNLKSHLKERYDIDLQQGEGTDNLTDINMLANEVQIPGVSMTSQDIRSVHKGVNMKPAMAKVFNEMDMSFILDVDAMPLRFFKGWQDFILGTSQAKENKERTLGIVQKFYNDYTMDVKIHKIEKQWGGIPGTYQSFSIGLVKAYPYMVSSIPYSGGSSQVVKLQVGMYYEHAYFDNVKDITPPIPTKSDRFKNAGANDNAGALRNVS
tara:strand:- start:15084 stop:15824 length:741 start_codon:yes stop_codon:yes gene_type:complete